MIPSWHLSSANEVEYFEYSPKSRLVLAFFTRRGGVSSGVYESLNTSFQVGDDAGNVERNFARVRLALRLPAILTVRQTHSDIVLPITDEPTPSEALEGDACITSRAGLGLGLKVADCLPVYMYAADSSCIGIAHCGWRGTVARLAEKTAQRMSREYSVPLHNLRFALGPCICPDHYEVGQDVRQEFAKTFPDPDRFLSPVIETDSARHSPSESRRGLSSSETGTVSRHVPRVAPCACPRLRDSQALSPLPPVKLRLDLRDANRWLLTEIGLTESESLSLCTLEDEKLFYSARRDKVTGRNLAVIALH
ncbi:MAG TPA: polyphenol oxidase family protein [bacterium]|nr:polyphenol oxidase family protein [bacterium]